jgi:hypothetical protein
MEFRTATLSALASSLIFCAGIALAADKDQNKDQTRDRSKDQTQLRDQDRTKDQARDQTRLRDDEPIYGSQLMTEQERIEHRNKMRSLKTYEEREAYRLEEHKKMQARAKEKGVTLPDEVPARGGMMGPGGGMGPRDGMGPGGGGMMRPGGGRY